MLQVVDDGVVHGVGRGVGIAWWFKGWVWAGESEVRTVQEARVGLSAAAG